MLDVDAARYPALAEFIRQVSACEGRVGEAEAPAAEAALVEFLADGARLGRSLRQVTAALRPADQLGAAIAYLLVITVDAAVHQGREGALAAYAAAGQPLSQAAGRLHAMLVSPGFGQAVGPRPVQGSHRGCAPAS